MNEKTQKSLNTLKQKYTKAVEKANKKDIALYSNQLFYYLMALKDAEVITDAEYEKHYIEMRKLTA